MYAIIQRGTKQYRVEPGVELRLDHVDSQPGDAFETSEVLLLNDNGKTEVGKPLLEGITVKGTVVDHVKGEKIVVFKMKRRQNYRRTKGHRDQLTKIKIDSIERA